MADADDVWILLAEKAGLHAALEDFRDDVQAAANSAAAAAAGLTPPADVRAEAWPPMKAGDAL